MVGGCGLDASGSGLCERDKETSGYIKSLNLKVCDCGVLLK
jgi:hypothetical protein